MRRPLQVMEGDNEWCIERGTCQSPPCSTFGPLISASHHKSHVILYSINAMLCWVPSCEWIGASLPWGKWSPHFRIPSLKWCHLYSMAAMLCGIPSHGRIRGPLPWGDWFPHFRVPSLKSWHLYSINAMLCGVPSHERIGASLPWGEWSPHIRVPYKKSRTYDTSEEGNDPLLGADLRGDWSTLEQTKE